jgi:hypothetical protein
MPEIPAPAARIAPRPCFLITIDTEGDNLWAQPREVTTRNARFLPRFQDLCERYGLKPTYLTDFDMVRSAEYCEFARAAAERGAAEIGMHLHAWNSPPIVPLTDDDLRWQPYLVEYPTDVVRAKVRHLTGLLEDVFQTKMLSHRAGRWSFDAAYARILAAEGYTSDCSVTPLVSWRASKGAPNGDGGTDFSEFRSDAYFLDLSDIARAGESALLEIPLTVMSLQPAAVRYAAERCGARSLARRALQRFFPQAAWLRPRGDNRNEMLRILKAALRERRAYVEFMLHSSELMPGGSPTFRTEGNIERLYEDLEALFSSAARHFEGATLSEFRNAHPGRAAGARPPPAAA